MQKKRGISLIVLVITIIVMIILAATIIISLNNNGIINKTQEAVDKTNEKQVQELASLAWAEAYADNVGKSEEELLPILKTAVQKALTDNNIVLSEYGMSVTTKGVRIVKGWLQVDEDKVVKGAQTLLIGDFVKYNPGTIETYESKAEKNGVANQVFDNNSYTVKVNESWKAIEQYGHGRWRVLGAEDGKVKLISAAIIQPTSGGKALNTNWYDGTAVTYNYFQLKGEKGCLYGIDELNNICALYGKGQYAESARSVNAEDLMASSKDFDPLNNMIAKTIETNRNSGTIGAYGYTVTYGLNSEGTKVVFNSENGAKMEQNVDKFCYLDEEKKEMVRTPVAGKKYTITNTNTDYYPIIVYNVENGGLDRAEIGFVDTIYLTTLSNKQQPYFVATRRNYCNPKGYNTYGIYKVENTGLATDTLYNPKTEPATEATFARGVRAVVILEEGVILSNANEDFKNLSRYYTTWELSK